MCVCVCVYVCVCVCVCERERERVYVCVCVCTYVDINECDSNFRRNGDNSCEAAEKYSCMRKGV